MEELTDHRWGSDAPGQPWLGFDAEGGLYGSDGCNRLVGQWVLTGDRLEFGAHASITVGMVRRYPSLEAMIDREGWQCVIPDAADAADAVGQIRALSDWPAEIEAASGVLALRVRDARRK